MAFIAQVDDKEIRFSSGSNRERLCDVCSSMTFAVLKSDSGFNHHCNLDLLRKEYDMDIGCPICSLIWKELQELPPSSQEIIKCGVNSVRVSLISGKGEGLQFLKVILARHETLCNKNPRTSYDDSFFPPSRTALYRRSLKVSIGESDSEDDEPCIQLYIKISTDHESDVASLIDHKRTFHNSNSDAMFRLVDSWIENCVQNHPECSKAKRGVLPTRLIDVGSTGESLLFLFLPTESSKCPAETLRYTALSYCWGLEYCGGKPHLKTTSLNLEDRKRSIDYEQLPRTICDAILITRQLGIRYIWVDSLCILQGDSEIDKADWEHESSRMGDVYGGAFLTIAAASARTMHDGIFQLREICRESLTKLLLESKASPPLLGPVYLGSKHVFVDSLDEPLFSRGWTLQERILSTRVLICKRDQFVLECQNGVVTESGVENKSIAEARLQLPINDIGFSEKQCPDLAWQAIMTDYSARSLSQPSDKLIAIAALAKEFSLMHNRTKDQYIAGLWTHAILDHLLWAHKAIESGHTHPRSRPSIYRAPSWSFAAVDGNVRWLAAHLIGGGEEYTRCESSYIKGSPEHPFGQVFAGYLILRGPLKFIASTEALLDYKSKYHRLEEYISLCWKVDVYLDASGEPGVSELEYSWRDETESGLWFLRIKDAYGLLLVPVRSSDMTSLGRSFRRVGVGIIRKRFVERFSETSVEETITLI